MLIELYQFIPLSITLTVCQGHNSVSFTFKSYDLLYPIEFKLYVS